MALDQEWDKLHPSSEAPRAEELNALLDEALYEVHNWTPMTNPGSQYLTEDLEAYLTGLAGDIFQAMGKERQKLLTNRVTHMVAALHEKA